ncbi:MAG: GGDEF domain-containing protein [Acidobacteriota bacterium]
MREPFRLRAFLVTVLPPLVGVSLLTVLGWRRALSLDAEAPLWLWLVLALVASCASVHRPLGGRTLGVGAVAVASLAVTFGPVGAAVGAGLAVFLGGLVNGRIGGLAGVSLPHHGRAALRAAMAVLFATWLASGPLALLLYLLAQLTIIAADRLLHAAQPGQAWRRLVRRQDLAPFALDGVAWIVGLGAARLLRPEHHGALLLLLAAVAGLALEAARNAYLYRGASHRLAGLGRVRRAAERMIGPVVELDAVIDRIQVECREVVACEWFVLEITGEEGSQRRWGAGPDGALVEGKIIPTPHPPPIPGVHRRSDWRVLDRSLGSREGISARLRVWCDPRRLVADQLELFDALLPQMSASLHQALLDREAREDPLTGAAVRRVLERRLAEVYHRACDGGGAFGVILCDLDHFKRINDTYGHAAGDQALIAVATVLASFKRTNDVFARYGGEEFALLLADIEGHAALAIAERLRQQVEEIDLEIEGHRLPLRMSAGVAVFPELHIKTASEIFLLADEALYRAKDEGRNTCLLHLGGGRFLHPSGRVVGSPEPVAPAEPPQLFA